MLPRSSRLETIGFLLTLALFLGHGLYIALMLGQQTAPDEPYHLDVIGFYHQASGVALELSDEFLGYGGMVADSYLSHLVMGKLLHLNFFGLEDITFIRLLHLLISAVGFFSAWLFLRLTIPSTAARLYVLLLMANTIMYFTMSGVASYDAMANACAMIGFYFIARLFKNFHWQDFLWLTLTCCIGNLAKRTFLPLSVCFAFSAIVLAYLHGNRSEFWVTVWHKKKYTILLLFTLGLFTANIKHYGGNIWQYGSPFPTCIDVYGEELCLKHYHQLQFQNEKTQKNSDQERISFFAFFSEYWEAMEVTLYGFTGHKAVTMNKEEDLLSHRVFFLLSFIMILLLLYKDRSFYHSREWWVLLGITLCYSLILAGENYLSYLRIGQLGIGLQGRYFLPILLPFYYVLAKALFHQKSKKVAWCLFFILAPLSFRGGTYFMYKRIPSQWLSGNMKN